MIICIITHCMSGYVEPMRRRRAKITTTSLLVAEINSKQLPRQTMSYTIHRFGALYARELCAGSIIGI